MDCKTSKKFKKLKSPDPRVKMKFVQSEGESQGIGICEAIVDASLAECVAYEFIKDSREKKAKDRYKLIETKKLNNHSQLYLSRRNLGIRGFSDREGRNFVCWQKEEGGKVCWTVYKDTNLLDEDFSMSAGIKQAISGIARANTGIPRIRTGISRVKSEIGAAGSGTVLASTKTTWMFSALKTIGGVPQTRVTFPSKVDIKGSVPSFVMNRLTTLYCMQAT
jgi:hypothetical protein